MGQWGLSSIHAAFDRFCRCLVLASCDRSHRDRAARVFVGVAVRNTLRCWSTRRWILALALGCTVLTSCSRSRGVFEGSPFYAGASARDVSSVVECIGDRWKRSTRKLHRSESGASVRLQGETFFRGVPIGVRVFRATGRTRVQFFQQRITDHIYVSFVKSCLQ